MLKLTEAHVIGMIIAFLLCIFIIPIVIYYSEKFNVIDIPDERKIHKGKTSRLGGIGIWFSVMLTFLTLIILSYYPKGLGLSGIIVGGSLMFMLGLVDDLFNLNAKFKLLIQVLIALMVILLGVNIDVLYNPFGENIILPWWLTYPISILWIVGITNAMNFIDGIDGLAGTTTTIACAAIGVISLTVSPASPITALVAFILMGAMLGFLIFNYHPAKIFMGDSGALYAGFMLATLSITGIVNTKTTYMYLPILILAIPILDVAISSIRRILKGSSPFKADAEHIHHHLLHYGFTQEKTLLMLGLTAFACAMIAIAIVGSFGKYFLGACTLIAILLIFNIISKVIKKK